MTSMKLSSLFLKRYLEKTLPSVLIGVIIFTIIGIIMVSTALPFKYQLNESISELPAEISISISQNGMTSLSLETIQQTFKQIFFDKVTIEYGIVLSLKLSTEEDIIIPYIGLSDGLLERLNISDTDIILGWESTNSQINITNPIQAGVSNITINTVSNRDLAKNSLYNHIFWMIRNYNLATQSSESYTTYNLIGNSSYGFFLAEELQINSNKLGGFFYGFLAEEIITSFTSDELSSKMNNIELSLFQSLSTKGFDGNYIKVHSPITSLLSIINSKVQEEIRTIQLLSIPNLILILILIFTLELGLFSFLKRDGHIFWSRGLSNKRLKLLFFFLELLADFIVCLLAFAIFIIIIFVLNLPNSLMQSLLLTYSIVFVLIILSKFVHFISFEYHPELRNQQEKSNKATKLVISQKIRITSIILFFIAFLILIVGIFEPLFWFPIISSVRGIAIDSIISIILVINTLIFFSQKPDKKEHSNLLPDLKSLTKRLFGDGLRKIRPQQITVTGLYALLIFLLLFSTTKQLYTKTIDNNQPIFDIILGSRHSNVEMYYGFNSSLVKGLTNEIPEIETLCTYQTFGANIIGQKEMEWAQILAFNASTYINLDLVWEHFVGSKGTFSGTNPFSILGESEIIINLYLAERIGARVGDKVGLDALYFELNGSKFISIESENLEIVGIVDTLPMAYFTAKQIPYAYIDFSLFEQMVAEKNLNSKVLNIGLNLNLTTDGSISKQEKEDQILNSILNLLNLNSSDEYSIYKNNNLESSRIMLAESKAQSFFIYFELTFAFLLLPITTFILCQRMINTIYPSLQRLGARGYSEKGMRQFFVKETLISFTMNIIFGILVGLSACLIYFRYSYYPSLFIATNSQTLLSILALLLIILIGGIISFGAILILSTKQIKFINNKGV